MDVRNCKDCGKIFNYVSGPPLCPSCLKELDKKFEKVKEYIYDHPGAGVQEVSDANDVTTAQIKIWIRQERLTFADDSPIGIDCEICGAIIKTGRYCNMCKSKMVNNLGDVYKKPIPERKKDPRENPKMRFLDQK
ncbi:flagellar operon protein (TIGR03826 family) [Mobilisporobacter senegalensis]|uniref:Flagellar operon protein (TIGR03826 family) n=1 Tax=Mobilisporobacter senegalensis TaxID=1329262 RepID=A0A3N1X5A8_9FIRM|nr:flagellar protein [Mobilisporobacter senegalensis]ROR21955.1 flagellar operon protein (TIGR03826 family) [Mobilisporobacter senegalensis]